jgi:peptidylprolyl isomerase
MKKVVALVFLFTSLLIGAEKYVVLHTNLGDIKLKMFPDIAPKTVENFTTHTNNGYYNGVIFHRVIKNFMIQCGDPTGTGAGGESIWGQPFEDEFKPNVVFNKSGILAMANRGRHTNGSQFFITTVPTPHLNGGHTIFGEVADGASMDVVRRIEGAATDYYDKPTAVIKIVTAEVIEEMEK